MPAAAAADHSSNPTHESRPIAAQTTDPHIAKAMAAAPHFPWLQADQPQLLEPLLEEAGVVQNQGDHAERVHRVAVAGEGNMNLTLRVWLKAANDPADTLTRSVIVKQARPWVEKYPMIAAPVDRSVVERSFYKAVKPYPSVATRMPELLGELDRAQLAVFADLGQAADLTELYRGQALPPAQRDALMGYLADLHDQTRGMRAPRLNNPSMRQLNHEHIFDLPFRSEPVLDLQAIEPGLAQAAAAVTTDRQTRQRIDALGQRYLADPDTAPASEQCLLHGDFFPGSWALTQNNSDEPSIWVIDPEFCFIGPAAFDLGVTAAHLIMAGSQTASELDAVITAYQTRTQTPADLALAMDFAATEILRRQLGVAQLPLTGPIGFRARLVAAAHLALTAPNAQAKAQALIPAAPERTH